MSTHGARRLAALLAGVSLAALLATVALLIPNAEGRSLTEYGVNGVFGLVLGASYPIVGWLIASRRPGNPIGWIMLAVGLSQSAEAFATNYAVYGLETVHTAIPFLDLAAWIEVWAWAPGFLLLGIVVLLFPDGELPSPRWRSDPLDRGPVVGPDDPARGRGGVGCPSSGPHRRLGPGRPRRADRDRRHAADGRRAAERARGAGSPRLRHRPIPTVDGNRTTSSSSGSPMPACRRWPSWRWLSRSSCPPPST